MTSRHVHVESGRQITPNNANVTTESTMSKSGMLRTRRRDVNVKPNRRLDRKSSRGMIYENEELRLRTININAEIERGQSDIKKLRRENEQLRKEIWCLRDEYDKLDKLLKEKDNCSSCTSDSDSCTSCTESEENEATQNLANVQKTALHNLRSEFDHLSVVTEENSAENSEKNSPGHDWEVLPPDQSYPAPRPKHFFAPIKPAEWPGREPLTACAKTSPDVLVTDCQRANSFANGGNLEELLQDIESISKDILQISQSDKEEKPYKSELNVVLLPKPMPLLGFEKYNSSIENLHLSMKSMENLCGDAPLSMPCPRPLTPVPTQNYSNPFFPDHSFDNYGFKNDLRSEEKTEKANVENENKESQKEDKDEEGKDKKIGRTRKVSIYFKGKKDKLSRSLSLDTKLRKPPEELKLEKKPSEDKKPLPKTPSVESKISEGHKTDDKSDRKHRKSSSTSPERKHLHEKKVHKKKHKTKRNSSSERNRERSYSICTDRSNILDKFDDYTNSERERTNSLSSCETLKSRKLSVSTFQVSGKIPWFGCWGNGCI